MRFEAVLLQVLLIAREAGLLRLCLVAIDGTKIDANASKIRSVRYDRAQALRQKLADDIAALTAQAEAADAVGAPDPQALPKRIARFERLKAQLDAACASPDVDVQREAEAARADAAARQAEWGAKQGRRGRRAKSLPKDLPPPDRQSNLTDPDSALMPRSRGRPRGIHANQSLNQTARPQVGGRGRRWVDSRYNRQTTGAAAARRCVLGQQCPPC